MVKKCPVCGVSVSTKARLRSHVEKIHASQYSGIYGNATTPSKRTRAGGGGGRGKSAKRTGRIPAPSSRLSRHGSGNIEHKAMERVGTYEIEADADPGIVLQLQFSPSVLSRLRLLSSGFQRITYNSLVFEVVAKSSTLNAGGYIAGFVPDPDDEGISLTRLAASAGADTYSWWQNADVDAVFKDNQRTFWTSAGGEKRLWSPGIFYIIADGNPTSKLSLTVNVHYWVHLSIPSLESERGVSNFSVITPLRVKSGDAILEAADGTGDQIEKMVHPVPRPQTILRLPFPLTVEYKEGSGDTGTLPFRFLYVGQWSANGGSKLYIRNQPTNAEWKESNVVVKWQADVESVQQLLPGDVLKFEKALENPVGLHQTRPMCSSQIGGRSNSLSSELRTTQRQQQEESVLSTQALLNSELKSELFQMFCEIFERKSELLVARLAQGMLPSLPRKEQLPGFIPPESGRAASPFATLSDKSADGLTPCDIE